MNGKYRIYSRRASETFGPDPGIIDAPSAANAAEIELEGMAPGSRVLVEVCDPAPCGAFATRHEPQGHLIEFESEVPQITVRRVR